MPKTGTTAIEQSFKEELTKFRAGRYPSQNKAVKFLVLAGFNAPENKDFGYSGDKNQRINISLSKIEVKLNNFKAMTGEPQTNIALYEALRRGAAVHFPKS